MSDLNKLNTCTGCGVVNEIKFNKNVRNDMTARKWLCPVCKKLNVEIE
jgi:hypothetical protein